MSAKQKMKLNIVNGGPAELDAPLSLLEVLARPEQAPAFDRRLLRAEGRALRASSYGFETEIQGLNMDELDVEAYEGTFVMDHKLLSPAVLPHPRRAEHQVRRQGALAPHGRATVQLKGNRAGPRHAALFDPQVPP
ncbi:MULTISPECIES: hypothetical protein [Sorangium]|uniref:Uncharacterized protein n=1 Tax=Sorangium cellulosum TaxID=56 RepID=A0A4P2QGN5_SORCE|nr:MULTISPECIES: hypothetical protein [Sorangium]AUX29010.1 uncharacterized protein SOCE836_010950 [Sorangium cellulosum]WCQ88399.1 hypothetical protein NQZ70_01075 [Sorangium sp. Soce836]